MKKILIIFLATALTGVAAQAQTDTGRNNMGKNPIGNSNSTGTGNPNTTGTSYQYYPQENLYYNPSNRQYSWLDPATNKWSSGTTLPSGTVIGKGSKSNNINYNGSDVWSSNADHRKNFGSQNNSNNNNSSNNNTNSTNTPTTPPKQ